MSITTLDELFMASAGALETEPQTVVAHLWDRISENPGHRPCAMLLAKALSALGRLDDALHVLSAARAANPGAADLALELARLLQKTGDTAASVAALEDCVRLNPNMAAGWLLLSRQLAALDTQDEADRARLRYQLVAPRDRRFADIDHALDTGRLLVAQDLVREMLAREPSDPEVLRRFANIQMKLGQHPQAETALRQALEIDPANLDVRYELAHALLFQQRGLDALAVAQRLFAVDPARVSYQQLEASACILIGEQERAADLLATTVQSAPSDVTSWMAYGHVLRGLGKASESIAAYRRAVALDPANGEAYWSLANLKTYRFDTADREAMSSQLNRVSLTAQQRVHFEFALAKCMEDDGQYGDSFAHYLKGNAQRRQIDPYNPMEVETGARRSRAVFTADFFAARQGYGSASAEPIFVIGMPRAGSTLIEQILASHSLVEGTMELPNIAVIATELGGGSLDFAHSTYPDCVRDLTAQDCRRLAERYLDETRIHRRLGRTHFIDKMPNNFARLGLIHLMFPNARIIDARRHPLSCCVSGFKQLFARGQAFSYDLQDIGRYYAEYVGLMEHFDTVLPGRVHRVFYDRMVSDTDSEVRKLLDYCGLAFEEGCLEFHRNKRVVRTASSEQVRRPIYRDSVDDWRNFEPWLQPLVSALGTLVDEYPRLSQQN
jgi:cytochrome c-type biogenesis protein CcmH/NrfG